MTSQDPTDEQLRIEVAGLMGWTSIHHEFEECLQIIFVVGTAPDGCKNTELPQFSECLNACAEMERSLSEGERKEYVKHIERLTETTPFGFYGYADAFALLTSTPRQRCEAFVRVKKGVK